jgi:PadR family transcriptional regulator, regulatory protein PadR
MRRKAGSLIPIEVSILEAGVDLSLRGRPTFYGFMIAKQIKDRQDARLLTAHGTLYRALDRLERSGFLESDWEDPLIAAAESRPRRRFYWVTAAGEAALPRESSLLPRTSQPTRRLATP